MPGLSNRNPVAGYGNIGKVQIRYKPKQPPKSKYGLIFFIICLFLFIFSFCWSNEWRRYKLIIIPLKYIYILYNIIINYNYNYYSFNNQINNQNQRNFILEFDKLGNSLIKGNTINEVLYGQGYYHAKERLFQMDYLRLKVYGNLSLYEGELQITSDFFSKALELFNFAEEDLKVQNQIELSYLQSYSDGINAYLLENHSLPIEYSILGISKVEPWLPLHSLILFRYYSIIASDSWETVISKIMISYSLKKDKESLEYNIEKEQTNENNKQSHLQNTASSSWGWIINGSNTESKKPILYTRLDLEVLFTYLLYFFVIFLIFLNLFRLQLNHVIFKILYKQHPKIFMLLEIVFQVFHLLLWEELQI